MNFFPDPTTFLKIGPLEIKWYAVFILTGALIAYQIIKSNFKKKGYPLQIAEDLFLGCLLIGILGARLWYVAFSNPGHYLANPLSILNFQEGGLAIHGGLFFGVAFAYFYLKRKGYDFISMADEILYVVLVAQGIGRWGNFINKEAFGPVIDERSLNFLPNFIKEGMFINGNYHMPTFLIESVLNILGFLIIHFLLRRFTKTKRGDLVYAYLMWYGVVRFFIEIFRTDALLVGDGGLKIAQIISILFIIVGLLGYMGVFGKIIKPSLPILVFDFDGTLLDTESTIIETFKSVFSEVETTHELSDEDYDSLVGPTLISSFERYVVNPDIDQLIETYRSRMLLNHQALAKPMPNALEALKSLKEKGFRIAIFSNKQTDMIKMGLDQVEMTPYIDLIVGQDLVEKTKPDPSGIKMIVQNLKGTYDNVVMIGDSVDDILAGQNANAYTIAYSENEKRQQLLMAQNPNAIIYSLLEIEPLLSERKLWNKYTI